MAMYDTSKYTYPSGDMATRAFAGGLARRALQLMASADGKPAVDGPAKPRAADLADGPGQAKTEDYHA